MADHSGPAAGTREIVEPEASVTLIEPGSAPAPAVHVGVTRAPTGALAGTQVPADVTGVLLGAYRSAVAGSPAACHLPVSLLAAIGEVESGSLAGLPLDAQHRTSVLGPVLDGHGVAAVVDTDHGRLDGNTRWDRAVGPMQFLPSTWAAFGVDGDGDGVANPQDVYDAAAGAADYLCFGGRDLTDPAALRRAILSYNHSVAYLRLVQTFRQRFTALGLDESGVTGLSTHLSLAALALPEGTTATPERAAARHDPSAAARRTATAAPRGVKEALTASAAAAPQVVASASSAGATPAAAPPPAAAASSTAPASSTASAPESPATGPSPAANSSRAAPTDGPTTPAAEKTKPTSGPTSGPTAAPDACPTAPVADPSPTTATPMPTPTPTPTPTPSADPTTGTTPADANGTPAPDPCAPCPVGVDPTPQRPCRPAATPTEPAPSSAP